MSRRRRAGGSPPPNAPGPFTFANAGAARSLTAKANRIRVAFDIEVESDEAATVGDLRQQLGGDASSFLGGAGAWEFYAYGEEGTPKTLRDDHTLSALGITPGPGILMKRAVSIQKKRKLEEGANAAAAGDVIGLPEDDDPVSWRVCCLDGTTFSVAVPEGALVAEMKRAIGALREVPHYAMELFVEGKEEPLDDEKRLLSAEKVPLFMLPKQVSDRLALEALYKSCGGAGWVRKGGWMTDAGLGEWDGVTVDAEGRVTELKLGNNNLAGPLPSELQQLSALQMLICPATS